MAEGTYEYEVMRAELLGVEKPDYDEFVRKQNEAKDVEQEGVEIENLKTAETESDELKAVSGKLDELNSLLSVTQRKINNFKFRCSSVTSYMKNRLGSFPFSASIDNAGTREPVANAAPSPKPTSIEEEKTNESSENVDATPSVRHRKSDLAKALENRVDKLDGLLDKAETAEISMQHQRKQMQSYMK